MKSLLLLRHAEAIAATPKMQEAQRPLTEFGESQCRTLGTFLSERGYAPDRIECSRAIRAAQTAKLVANAAAWTTPVESFKHLYIASCEELMAQAGQQGDEIDQLLLVAHAPGVADLVSVLVTETADAALLCEPATIAEVVLDIDHWSAIEAGSGSLRLILQGM